jgi:hypothetical protein
MLGWLRLTVFDPESAMQRPVAVRLDQVNSFRGSERGPLTFTTLDVAGVPVEVAESFDAVADAVRAVGGN